MTIVEGDFEARARRVFDNLKAISEAAGGSLSQVVKITVFLTDLNDFATVNAVMDDYFDKPYAARAAVEVSALPKGSTWRPTLYWRCRSGFSRDNRDSRG